MLKMHVSCLVILMFQGVVLAQSKFLLLLGPSGVGKSTIIRHLKAFDRRFEYVTPMTTRQLREGEKDKVHIPLEEMRQLEAEGRLLTINNIYGTYYATPKSIIDTALDEERFPVLDWPVQKMEIMRTTYPDQLFVVYVAPENTDELLRRLALDNRDTNGQRYALGKDELEHLHAGDYNSFIDLHVVNAQGHSEAVARTIYEAYCSALNT